MLHVVLFEPEIPPNTGNIIRLCANIAAQLHLIHPLGFSLDTKSLRRAGLDYHEYSKVKEYKSIDQFMLENHTKRIFACTTKSTNLYHQLQYAPNDMFLFGPETRGLPDTILNKFFTIKIPMHKYSRSLNLSNAVAVVLYEAWRQLDFN